MCRHASLWQLHLDPLHRLFNDHRAGFSLKVLAPIYTMLTDVYLAEPFPSGLFSTLICNPNACKCEDGGVTHLDFQCLIFNLKMFLTEYLIPLVSVWVAWLRYVTVELVAVDHYMCPWAVGPLSLLLGVCLSLGDVSSRVGPFMGPLFMTVKLTAVTSSSCAAEITLRFW